MARQSAQLENDVIDYPPSLYVPQRYVRVDGAGRGEGGDDVLDAVVNWLDAEEARLVLVLANFGHGKTFLLRELARRLPKILPNLVPVLVELKTLEKNHSLDALLAQHLASAGEERIDIPAVRRMLERGQLLLLFDGFDELALAVGYDRAAEHLGTIVGAVTGRAKVVLSSRTQHFATDNQWRTALGDEVDLVAGSRLVQLGEFADGQIREFLIRQYDDDEARADARLELIHDIKDLLGLSRNPRMLSFIASLQEDELQAVRRTGGGISSADLYQGLIDRWLRFESNRRRPTLGSVPGLDVEEIRRAVTALALRMWQQVTGAVDLRSLTETTQLALHDLTERHIDPQQAVHTIGAGSLLVRGDADRFGFIHVSVMEYLVAAECARRLREPDGDVTDLLAGREMSQLMADFLCESAGREAAERWSRKVLADPAIIDFRQANAVAVSQRLRLRDIRVHLAGQDLRRLDLSEMDLRFADMSGADLRGVRLRRTDLTGVRLAGAVLADAVLEDVTLDRADLTGADFRGARLSRTSMRAVRISGGRWERTAVLGGSIDQAVLTAPELADVAVAGRDRSEAVVAPVRAGARAVAYAPTGKLVASAWGRNVVLIEPTAGRVIRTLAGHPGPVLALAFSPDGAALVSAGADGTVRCWAVEDAAPRWTVNPQAGAVHSVAVSRDGTVAAIGCADGTVRRLDLARRPDDRRPGDHGPEDPPPNTVIGRHEGPVGAVAFSPDGRLVAAVGGGLTVQLWRVADGTRLHALAGHSGWVRAVAFSPDGARLASGGFEQVRVWDVETGAQIAIHPGHAGGVWSVAFSPDGTVLASSGADEVVRLWRSADGRSGNLGGHFGRIWSIAFSPDGSLLASAAADQTVQVHNVETGRRVCRVTGRPEATGAAGLSPNGALTVTGMPDRTIRVWETRTGRQLRVLAGHPASAGPLVVSPDGTLVAGGDASRRGDGTVQLWALADGTERATLAGHGGGVGALAFSPDGSLLASSDGDGHIRLWDAGSGERLSGLAPDPTADRAAGPWGIAFSPDGRLLARAAPGGPVELFAIGTGGRRLDRLDRLVPLALDPRLRGDAGAEARPRTGPGPSAAAPASGTRPASRPMPGMDDGATIGTIAFGPNSRRIAAGGSGGQVRLWDVPAQLPAGGPRLWHSPPEDTAGEVCALAFSPDGASLAVGGVDGLIRLLTMPDEPAAADLAPGAPDDQRSGSGAPGTDSVEPAALDVRARLVGHIGAIRSIAFGPDATMVVSASADGTNRVWETASGRWLATFVGLPEGGWALLLPDGRYRLAGDPADTLWWVIRERTFTAGIVDGADPAVRRLEDATPIPGLAHLPVAGAPPLAGGTSEPTPGPGGPGDSGVGRRRRRPWRGRGGQG